MVHSERLPWVWSLAENIRDDSCLRVSGRRQRSDLECSYRAPVRSGAILGKSIEVFPILKNSSGWPSARRVLAYQRTLRVFLPGTRERRRMKESQCVIPTSRSGFDEHPPSILKIDEGRIVASAVREKSRFEHPLRRKSKRPVETHRPGGRCLWHHEYSFTMPEDIRIRKMIRLGEDNSVVRPGLKIVAVRERDLAKSGPGTEGFEEQVPALAGADEEGVSYEFGSRPRDVPTREDLQTGGPFVHARPRIGASEESDRPFPAGDQPMCLSGPQGVGKQSAGKVLSSLSGSGQCLDLSLISRFGDNGMRANTGSAVS